MPSTQAKDYASEQSTSIPKERRFKLSRACDRCRGVGLRRRIKCDEGHPCQACLGAHSACTFEEPGKRSNPHKSKRTATLEDRMHHLESLIQAIPPAVPPPSLNTIPLINPSTHFTTLGTNESSSQLTASTSGYRSTANSEVPVSEHPSEESARMSLSSSYIYVDDEGFTRWQGETSGLPILDLLIERHHPTPKKERDPSPQHNWSNGGSYNPDGTWFPNRTTHRTDINPERIWKLVTSSITPDLMDSLVQCYLSTSYYLMPFLHVPTFLNDYGDPQKWGEPGFVAFVVAVCCLASRHIDDPRVRANPNEGVSSGTMWFDLFNHLRTLPGADRPTLYTVQATLVAGVYTVGWGKLSKAFALFSESITLSLDAGLHRSTDAYDIFDAIEEEVRKRTFWCVYMWDKQAGAHFGRPPLVRLRDCDVSEPAAVDDEFITRDSVGPQPTEKPSRMGAFICVLRLLVVLESVLDTPPPKDFGDTSSFMRRATTTLTGFRRHKGLREEEILLDEVSFAVPMYWRHSPDTLASEDVIRVIHAERVYCLSLFIRMLIMRHRFSDLVAERAATGELDQSEQERDAMTVAHSAALQLISTQLKIAQNGLMTYYGVHVIHQLTQAGRTLIGFLLSCQADVLRPLIAPALDGLGSCVGLLRRFSDRYVCGQRSCDMMEEFCRLTQIPLDNQIISQELMTSSTRPPWIRPARKKNPSGPRSTSSVESPPHDTSEFASSPISAAPPNAPSFNLTTGLSSVARNQSPQRFSVETFGGGDLELPKSDPDTSSVPMSPVELMAFVEDGGIDVASLFPQQSVPGFLADLQAGTPYEECLGQCTYLGSNGMAGAVGTP
ncbi:fungal-specific transcription factor domain-containing protein [Lactarius quietus]|nr:fungal-specific transcription factor domain-containing protein [Lactarius quietus]